MSPERRWDISLPWPPTVNTYYRAVNGRNILSKKGREYKNEVAAVFRHKFPNFQPLACKVWVSVFLCPPDKRRRDIDNYIKAVLDALTGAGAWEDDSQIESLTIQKLPQLSEGPVVVSFGEHVEIRSLPEIYFRRLFRAS